MSYRDDRHVVERILLDAACEQTVQIEQMSADDLKEMERRYSMRRAQLKPRVYWRMTEGWVELSVRFIARDHAIRELKDAMTREILGRLDAAHIAVGAPTGLEIVSLPPLRVQRIPQHSERVAGDRPKGNGQRH